MLIAVLAPQLLGQSVLARIHARRGLHLAPLVHTRTSISMRENRPGRDSARGRAGGRLKYDVRSLARTPFMASESTSLGLPTGRALQPTSPAPLSSDLALAQLA
jgi:hypothetical protein